MKLKILLYIIYFVFSFSTVFAQTDGNNEYGKDQWDNWVEFNISDVKFTTEGTDRFFECTIRTKKLGDWYNYSTGTKPSNSRSFTQLFNNVTLNFSYNSDVFDESPEQPVVVWGENWEDADGSLYNNLSKELQEIDNDKYLYFGWEGYTSYTPKMPDGEYVIVANFKWKLKPGATGKTGLKIRSIDEARGSAANNEKGWIMAIERTGNGDTLIPNTNTPTKPILAIGLDSLFCLADSQLDPSIYSIVSIPDAADTCIWTVAPADAAVITYVNDTAVSIQWNKVGEHTLSVIARNAVGDSDPATMTIKIFEKPTATLELYTYACEGSAVLTFSDLEPTGTAHKWLKADKINEVANANAVTEEGEYHLALNNGGCVDTLTTEVKLNVQPEVIVQRIQASCGTTVQLTAEAKDHVGTVRWYKDDACTLPLTDLSIRGSKGTPQHYWVRVETPSGCKSEVVQVTAEFGTMPTADIPPVLSQCAARGPEFIVLPVVNLGNGITAKWYKDGNWRDEVTVADASGGVYALILDDAGCTDTIRTNVEYARRPVANVLPVITACTAGEAVLSYSDLSAGTATWLGSNKQPLANGTLNNIKVPVAGQYYLALKEETCTDTLSVWVEINGEIPNILVPPVFTACGNKTHLEYEGGGNATLSWLDQSKKYLSSQNPYALVSNTGLPEENYFLKMEGSGGCKDTLIPVTVKYNTKPEVTGLRTEVTACGSVAVLSYSTVSGGRAGWAASSTGSIISEAKSYAVQKTTDKDTVTYYLRLIGNGTTACDEAIPVKVIFNSDRPNVSGLPSSLTACADKVTLQYDWISDGTAKWLGPEPDQKVLSALNPYVATKPVGSPDKVTYYLKIEGNGCDDTVLPVEVQYNTIPGVIVHDQTACGSQHTLLAERTGGTLKWLRFDNSPILSPEITDGSGIQYYKVYADGGSCKSDTATFSVAYNTNPVVKVADQTSCEAEHRFIATTTDGELKWLDNTGAPVTNPVAGPLTGTVNYKVYADGGVAGCLSDTIDFTVTYGTRPVVTVENQTSCDLTHVLTASTTAGELKWLNAAGTASVPRMVMVDESGEYIYKVYAEDKSCNSDTVSFTVNFGMSPKVEVNDQTACETTHTLYAKATGGTLLWYNAGDQLQPISPLVTGTDETKQYKVKAIEGACSSDLADVSVTFGRKPVVTVEDQTTCDVAYMPVASTTAGTLEWFNTEGQPVNLPLSGTIGETNHYKVKAVDGDCESDMQSFSVTFGTRPRVIVANQTSCNPGNQYTLEAEAIGGNLVWLNAQNERIVADVSGIAGAVTTYRVYTDGGMNCVSDTAEFTVSFGVYPVVDIKDQVTCGEQIMPVVATTAGELEWSDDLGQKVYLPLRGDAGKTLYYKVKAKDDYCESEPATFSVTYGERPTVNVADQTTCTGDYTLTAEATGGNLKWLYNNTLISPVITGVTATRKYRVYADGGSAGCMSDTLDFTVNYGARPTVTVHDQTTCSDKSYLMTAEHSGGELVWLEANTSKVVNNPIVGGSKDLHRYRVIAKYDNCVSDTATFSVVFGTSPQIEVEDQTSCSLNYTLRARTTGGSLVWLNKNGQRISANVTADANGVVTYKVFADGGNCQSDTVDFTVTFGVQPVVEVADQTTCSTQGYTLVASTTGGQLEWFDAAGTTRLASNIVDAPVDGSNIAYYNVRAKDGECGVSTMLPFSVTFGTRPVVSVEDQTACETEHTLVASATGGNLVWLKNNAPISPIITGGYGIQAYQVYADGGSAGCVSDTVDFTVTYGVSPVVNVRNQSICDTMLMLTAETTAGTLKWYTKDNNPVSNPVIGQVGKAVDYLVQAVDGKCKSDMMPFTVNFGTRPLVEVSNQTSCSPDYMLKAETSGGRLVWLDKTNKPISPVITGGHGTQTYKVYADGGSCKSDTVSFTVTYGVAPIVTVADQVTCATGVYSLQAATTGGKLQWYTADDTQLPSNIVRIPAGVTTEYYAVGAKDGECVTEKIPFSVSYGVHPVVNVQDQTACGSEHAFVATTTGGNLKWLNDAGVSVTNPVTGGSGTVKYKVYADAGGSCQSDTVAFTVKYNTDPVVSVQDITTCDTIVMLSAETSAGTLKWYKDINTTQEITSPVHGAFETVGSYYVKAVDGACESDVKALTVNFGMKPVVTVSPQTSCDGNHILTAETTGGKLVFLKNGTPISPIIENHVLGGISETYEVYADGGGTCKSDVVSFTVTFGVPPVVTVADQSTCDESYRLMASTTGGQLEWFEANGTTPLASNIVNAPADNSNVSYYKVGARDGECVSAIVPFSVTFNSKPHVTVLPQTSCAYTYTLNASASGGTLKWLKADKKTQIAQTVTAPETPGYSANYYVFADGGSCQSDTLPFTVTFGVAPTVVVENQSTCDTMLLLKARTSGGELVWWNGDGTDKISNPVVGTMGEVVDYMVQAVDGTCVGDMIPFTVSFGAKPHVTVSPQTSCDGDYVLTAETTGGNLVFLKNGVPISPIITGGTSTQTYQVYADGGDGCVSDPVDFTVTYGVPPVVEVENGFACGTTYTLTAKTTGGTLKWYKDALASNEITTPAVTGQRGEIVQYYVKAVDGTCESELKSFTVTFGSQPQITVSPQTSCAYTYTLQATATAGSTLKWMDAAKQQIAQTVTATQSVPGHIDTYYVYADGGGCKSDTVPFTVTYGVAPVVTVEDQTACTSQNYALVASTTGGQLEWFKADGTTQLTSNIVNAPVDGSKIAYYKVRAKDGVCGESPMMSFSVMFGTRPVVNVQDQTSCDGDHTLTATTTGGKLMWLQNNAPISPVIKDHATGGAVETYEVYASDGSCQSDTLAFKVTYGVLPVVTVQDITTCDTVVMLSAETSGGILKWYKDAAATQEITSPLVHGARRTVENYYVKAVDGDCESPVKALTVSFGAKPVVTVLPQTSCDGDHILTATTTEGTLVWMNKNGVHISPEITGRPVNGNFETYKVYAEGSGCMSDTVSFTVTYGVPPVVTVADQSTCETSYRFVASTTGGSLVWLDKDANNEISGIVQNGTGIQYYNVKAVDGECESAVMPFSVTFGTRPVVNVLDQTSCAYTYTLQATTTSGGTLKWLDAAKQQIARTVTVMPETPHNETYHVYVDGGVGCVSDTAAFTVAYGASPVVTVQDITTCDTIVMLSAETSAGTLKWYKDINATQEITSPVHGAFETVGSYYVKAVDGACESDVKALTVNFGMKPVVTVSPQTSCDGNHILTAETTGGNLVFLKNGVAVSRVIQNHPLNGVSEPYQVYAQGSTCVSDTMNFTVTFGVPPVVTVVDQSTCDESYRLMASTTGGQLEWFEANGTTPLASNIVNAPADNSNVSYYKVGARDGECVSQPLPFSVTFNSKPHVTVLPQTSCAYTYTLNASASGGTLKWLKSDRRTQITQTVTAPETPGYSANYYVFADGGSCQSDTLPFTVTFGVAPTVVVENQSTCDTMLLLKARTSGGELVWWNGDGTDKISNPVVGTIGEVVDYMVQAVDGTCEGEKLPFSVDFGVKPVVSVEDQTSCNGDHVLTAVITGGSPVWMQNNAPISPIITNGTSTQTYQVYADGGDGCVSDTVDFTVTYGVPPIVEVENGFACGTTYTLTAKTTDGTLKWYKDALASNEITTPAVTGQIGETVQYYVRAVGGENCESELKPFTVTFGAKPEVKVFDQTSCDWTHTLSANVVGGTAKWLAADGITSIQQTQTVSANGKVTYQVYADGGTCQSDTLAFTVDYGADPVITVKSPQTVCGNTYKLDAVTTGGVLKWYQNDETTEVTNPVTVNNATTDVTYKLQAVDGTCKSDMMPFTVSFNTKPEVKVFDQSTCGTTLTLEAQATGGNLVWLNAAGEVIGKTVTGNKNTNANYKVYATGGENCNSDTVTFNVAFGKEPYAVGLPKFITSCGATDALLFFETLSDAKATYKWLDGSGREIAATNPHKVTKEGVYSLQVTGTEAGCVTTTPVEVIFNQSPMAEGLPDVITSCTGEAELFFDNLTMVGATYEWYKSADGTGASIGNTNPLKVNAEGNYSLKITAAGCGVTVIPVQVKLNTPPVPLGLPEVASTCGGTEAYLSFTLSDRNATFAWSKGGVPFGNDNPLKVTEAGTYRLTIKGTGCADDVTKEVKVETGGSRPVADAGVDQTIKSGDNVQLFGTVTGGTAPYKYKWKPGAAVSVDQDTIQAPLSVALTEATEFYLQVTDKAGCVSLSDTMKVTLTPDAFKVQATAAPQNICMKNTSQLNAVLPSGMDETGVTYSWTGTNLNNSAVKAPVFTPAAAGDYAFAVVVKKGNNTTLALTNVKVGSGEAPVLAMEMLTSCVNDTVWVENTNGNITDPLGYKWYLDNVQRGTETYFVLPSGTHKLQVVANAGACASDTLTQSVEIGTRPSIKWITEPALEVTAGQRISGTAGIDVQGTAPYQYTWIKPAALEAISDSTFEISRATGFRYSFEVYATDAKGCLSDTLLASTKVISAGNLALQLEVIKDNYKICKDGVSLLKATIGKRTTAPYKFEWFKDGETTPLKTTVTNELGDQFIVAYGDFASASQKYYVQVSDSKADGQSTDSQEAILTKDEGHTAPKVIAGAEQTILSGASTVLLAEPSVAGTYEWFWSPASKLMSEGEAGLQYPQTAVLTAAQEYQVYISDANCVSAPAITKVNVSADGYMLKATPDTVLCIGNTVLLKAKATGKNTGSLTYEWKVGGSLLSSKDTATYRATGDGNFVAVVTAKANGKVMAAARVNITVRSANAPVFDLIANVPGCQRDTLKVQYQAGAVQAISYEWRVNGLLTTATTDRYVLAGDPGTYKVEVVGHGADGCRSAIDSATLNVALSPEILSVGMVDSCGQSIVEVQAKDALNYTWEAIQGGGSVNPLNQKQYIVEGNDDPTKEKHFEVKVKVGNATCSASRTFSGIVYSKPIMGEIDIQPSTPISVGGKITATALAEQGETPYSFHWLEPGVREGAGERVYEIDPAKYASYIFEVYVVDANGCMSDTITSDVAVAGGIREVRLDSRYGTQICKGGAAILDVQALGFGKNFTLELYSGSTLLRTKACNTSRDTFWVFPSADITYKVVAKSLSGTDVAEKTLALSVNNNNIAPVISAGPDMTVPMNGSTVLLGSAPEGVDVHWVWSPANKLATVADTSLQYPQTARLQANQAYSLYAVDNQSCLSKPDQTMVYVDNVNGFVVEITPGNPEVCKSGLLSLQAEIMEGRVSDQAGYQWLPDYYLDRTDTSTVAFTAPSSAGKYEKIVLVSDKGRNSAAKTSVNVLDKQGFTLEWAQGRMACVGDTLRVIASVTGLNYTWKVNGQEVSSGVDSIFVLGTTDRNNVEVFAKQTSGGGCVSDVLTKELTVGKVPVVDILQGAFAAAKDAVIDLNIVDAADLGGCGFVWSSKPADMIDTPEQGMAITKPLTKDVRYIYTASSPQSTACQASDSVNVYLIPEAPAVTIKGNTGNTNIVLNWSRVEGADNYVVKYTENDPYNILGEGYKVAETVPQSAGSTVEWAETSIREMAFYQVMAQRSVTELGSEPILSAVTDTLGFTKYAMQVNNNGETSFNTIAVLFDIDKYCGFKTTKDLGEYLTNQKILSIGKWDFDSQTWHIAVYNSRRGWTKDVFDLLPYQILQIEVVKPFDLMLYGRLLPVKQFDFKVNNNGSNNEAFLHLNKSSIKSLKELGENVGGRNSLSVGKWNFTTQTWTRSLYNSRRKTWSDVENGNIKIGTPLQLEMINSIKW